MKTVFRSIVIVGLLSPSAIAQQTVAGDWMLTVHEQFGPNIMRLSLVVEGEKLTGTVGSRPIEGTVRGGVRRVQERQRCRQGIARGRGAEGRSGLSRSNREMDRGADSAAASVAEDARFRAVRISSVFLVKREAGAAHSSRRHRAHMERRCRWPRQAGKSTIRRWQSADRSVLCRRGAAERYAGRTAQHGAHEPRLGGERKHHHAQRPGTRDPR